MRVKGGHVVALQQGTATQVYHIIKTFFPGLAQEKFDVDYRDYLRVILRSDDRREFDLASMEFIASLTTEAASDVTAEKATASSSGQRETPAASKPLTIADALADEEPQPKKARRQGQRIRVATQPSRLTANRCCVLDSYLARA